MQHAGIDGFTHYTARLAAQQQQLPSKSHAGVRENFTSPRSGAISAARPQLPPPPQP